MIRIPGPIPISINPLFWLVALFISLMSGARSLFDLFSALVVILISVLLHEFGHALTAICFKQKTRIELAAFGGFTYRQGRKLKLWEEFIVVLNGPLMGVFLVFLTRQIVLSAYFQNTPFDFLFKYALLINFYWTAINLIPVLPLDGGHLMSILLEAIFGFRGVKIALILGLVISVGVSLYFFAIGQFFVGALFLILTFESFRSLKYFKLLSEKDRDADLQTLMKEADTDFQAGKDESALEKLNKVREKTSQGILYTLATVEIAEILKHQNKDEEAYALLKPIQKDLSEDQIPLFQMLAFVNSDYQAVISIGDQCYQHKPTYETALINALSHAALSHAEAAVGWLECAIRDGLPKIHEILKRPELDPIREDPKFKRFIDKRLEA